MSVLMFAWQGPYKLEESGYKVFYQSVSKNAL